MSSLSAPTGNSQWDITQLRAHLQDAVDLEFWTIQEYASGPPFPNGDDRWGMWWGKITPPRTKG